ncbi:MAG: hypothetical protein GY716_23650 [bacterium]|nr:hypothetical protein [bacterium]
MTLRCKHCHGSIWIQAEDSSGGSAGVSCRTCGQTYTLNAWPAVGKGRSELAKRARRLARDEKLDLQGAYSVLLGIATADELREIGAGASTLRTPATDGERTQRFDRAFQPAIDEGLLSGRQAAERGNRDTFAANLASRHQFPMDIAYDVTDNRISLLEAIRKRPADAIPLGIEVPSRNRRPLVLGMLALALAIVLVVNHESRDGRNAAAAEQIVGNTTVATDDRGRPIEVSGPDPRSVLRTYCLVSDRSGRWQPLKIVPTTQADDQRTRLGLLRDTHDPEALLAITIHEDLQRGLWRAGAGNEPILAHPAPSGIEQSITNP